MDSLAYYAVLGTLVAAAAGVLVLIAAAMRVVRLGDTVALLCFAVAAGLAIVAVMQQARATGLAVAAGDVGGVLERMEALETRVARVELQPQAAQGAAPEPGAGEDRIARLERRIDAVEARATSVAPRVSRPRAAQPTVPASPRTERVTGAQPQHPDPARPLPALVPSDGVAPPEATTGPNLEPAMTTPSGDSSAGSAIVAPPMGHPVSAAVVKRNAGAGEWRETWNGLKRLLGQ